MSAVVGEAKALRAWAVAQGYEVGVRGRLPETVRDAWVVAGHPWPEGTRPPKDWDVTDYVPNSPRRNGHQTRWSETPDPARAAAASSMFEQPSPATRVELGMDPLIVDLVAGGTAEVMTDEEAQWFIATRDRYLEENRFDQVSDLQDLDRLLTLELLMHRDTKWLASGKDYAGNRITGSGETGKQLKERNASIQQLKDSMGLSKKARDASATGVNERWADLLKRARQWNYQRVEQLRTALLLMNRLSKIVGTYDRSDEEERRRTGYRNTDEIVEWIRDEMLPKYHLVDAYFRENEQSTWKRG